MTREAFILKYKSLFWYFDETKLPTISDAVIVEFILNYGSLEAVKELFELLGKKNVAELFSEALTNSKNNYFDLVRHFFNLYFLKNVPGYPF